MLRVSGETGNGFPSRSFKVSIASASDSESTMIRRDLSGRCGKLPFPPVFGCISEIGKCFLNMEHEQGYVSICSIGENQRGWIKEGD